MSFWIFLYRYFHKRLITSQSTEEETTRSWKVRSYLTETNTKDWKYPQHSLKIIFRHIWTIAILYKRRDIWSIEPTYNYISKMATSTDNKTEITLKGSVEIVSEFFFTAIKSILYQRGKQNIKDGFLSRSTCENHSLLFFDRQMFVFKASISPKLSKGNQSMVWRSWVRQMKAFWNTLVK